MGKIIKKLTRENIGVVDGKNMHCMKESVNEMEKILVTRSSMPPIEEYIEMMRSLWDSRRLTNMGDFHQQLEAKLQDYLGVNYLSLMVNGHMALELAIQSMNFPKGSEVITTPFTFISTTHAIIRNHLRPIFCDIKKEDYTIDENKIEELITEKTVAIIPVHVYGNPCNVDEIAKIAAKYDLKVIYDAAHAFGEELYGQKLGTFGDASVYSFHATKVYNTIEGGAVCCHLKELYDRLYNLKNFGIRSEELTVSVGANAKMNEFAAIMGLCNLRHLQAEIEKRKHVSEQYHGVLESVKGIRCNRYADGLKPNYAYYPVLFDTKEMRDRVYGNLLKEGIHARKYFYPLTSDAACFKNKYRGLNLANARYCSDRVLVLPMYADLEKASVEKISSIIRKTLDGR